MSSNRAIYARSKFGAVRPQAVCRAQYKEDGRSECVCPGPAQAYIVYGVEATNVVEMTCVIRSKGTHLPLKSMDRSGNSAHSACLGSTHDWPLSVCSNKYRSWWVLNTRRIHRSACNSQQPETKPPIVVLTTGGGGETFQLQCMPVHAKLAIENTLV